jgi:hypothetical protein
MLAAALALAPNVVAQDKWKHGIGTGLFALNVKGDTGFTTALGPVELEADVNFDELREVLESAFGVGGYAAKGKWTLLYSAFQLSVEDSISGTGPLRNPASAGLDATYTGGEFAAAYRFAVTGKHAWSVLGGIRYLKHEYDFGVAIDNDPPNPPATLTRNIDEDWTDLLVGLTHATRLGDRWTWSNRLDAGFGGSEGTYFFNTSFNWQFTKSWALSLYGQITSIDFENDNPGDPDYYLYDADEFGPGLNILYTF